MPRSLHVRMTRTAISPRLATRIRLIDRYCAMAAAAYSNSPQAYAVPMAKPAEPPTSGPAIVVGVGPGLGWSLCRVFARAGYHVTGAARREEAVEALAAKEKELHVRAAACD